MPLGAPPYGGGEAPKPPKRNTPSTGSPTPSTPNAPQRDPFSPSPVFGQAPAAGGWQGDVRPTGGGSYGRNVIDDSLDFWGAPTSRTSVVDTYTQQYGADAVQRAQASGLDPEVYFNENLTDKARGIIDQWGSNLADGSHRQIAADQQQQYDMQQAQYARDDAYMEQFDAFNQSAQSRNQTTFDNSSANAAARHGLAVDELTAGRNIDLGILGERRFRDIDLGRADNAADMGYLNTMRGITDAREGIRGEQYGNDVNYYNQNINELGIRQNTAYDRFMENDTYGAQQAQDNNAQYGFTGRQYEQATSDAFSQRNTQNRANLSASAAAGSFGSAGFEDNRSDIAGQYESALSGAGLTMDRQNQQTDEQDRAIGHGRELNRLGYRDTQSGFRGENNALNTGMTSNRLGYENDLQGFAATRAGYDRDGAKLENVGKSLDSLGKEYGLKAADIENQFQSAVTGAGLDFNDVQQKLEQQLNSGNAQLQQQANNFMYQMMGMQ